MSAINGINIDNIVFFSTPGPDIIFGTPDPDSINGLDGDDELHGGEGNDRLDGGNGNDGLFGDDGDDTLIGGSGDDRLFGMTGNDILEGGLFGNDQLDGGTGADRMSGGFGNNIYVVDDVGDVVIDIATKLLAGGRDDVFSSITYTLGPLIENLTLTGSAAINGTGNILDNGIEGNDTNNLLSGLDGDDQLIGKFGDDQLNGGNGNDQLDGGVGNDLLIGGKGTDSLKGGLGNDTYVIASYGDTDDKSDGITEAIGAGVDTVKSVIDYQLGNNLENLMLTGSGLTNGTGNALGNKIYGNSSSNVLIGLEGNDELTGYSGCDQLNGGTGNDLLLGGAGADTLTGGVGTDLFKYFALSDSHIGIGRDVITDFGGAGSGRGDRISLSAIDANELLAGNQAFDFIDDNAFTAPGQVRYAGGVLQASTDADTLPEFEIQLVGAPTLFVNPESAGTDILL